ncbi:MAG TPA: ABC transporter permease [Bryobacteraceae bacterium]|nr:ABC transporter permease [Bryobacteraceae bacterium]
MWVSQALQDLRYALRVFTKSPGFTAVLILTLALGIGANTAVFSIVNAVLLRPLPFREPDRLIAVWDKSNREKGLSKVFNSYADFEEYVKHSRLLDQITPFTWIGKQPVLTGHGPAQQLKSALVGQPLFDMLGVQAEIGRTFLPDDVKGGCTLVLSDAFWRTNLGASADIVGKTLTLDNAPCMVLGIMPAAFVYYPNQTDVWMLFSTDMIAKLRKPSVGIFARLKPGVTIAQAQAELLSLHSALHRGDSRERDFSPGVYSLQENFTFMAGRNLETTLWVLLGAVGLVLLIACLNVANLLLGRSLGREREFAVRAALGSGSARLARQLLVEALLLSLCGGLLGVLFAYGAIRYFVAVNPVELPASAHVGISLPVLAFTGSVAVLTAILFALVPAWRVTRASANEGLRLAARGAASGSGNSALAKTLVIAEMALSLVLLVGAGLFMESVLQMEHTPLGYQPDNLMATLITLPVEAYPDPSRRAQYFDELHRKLNSMPGVRGATISSSLPPYGGGNMAMLVEGRPVLEADDVHDVGQISIATDYFSVLGVALEKGRMFDARDRQDSEAVAVVNEALAKEYFPSLDPIGQHIHFRTRAGLGPRFTIVGVAGNEKRADTLQEMKWVDRPIVFRPLAQEPPSNAAIAVRTIGDPSGAATEIRREVAAVDSGVPVTEIKTMAKRLALVTSYPRFRAVLISAFAGFALLLAALGLHGVLAQFVSQRTQEIGVRMAMGAQTRDVFRLILVEGGIPVVSGLVLGLIAAIALSRYLANLLYGVRATDPVTFACVSLALLVVAAIAIVLPGRRAIRVDPMVALRNE